MKSNAELAETVKVLRSRRNWSQRMLEDRAGIGRGYISILESGGMKSRPKLSTLMKIAQALRVPLVVFTGEMEESDEEESLPVRRRENYERADETEDKEED